MAVQHKGKLVAFDEEKVEKNNVFVHFACIRRKEKYMYCICVCAAWGSLKEFELSQIETKCFHKTIFHLHFSSDKNCSQLHLPSSFESNLEEHVAYNWSVGPVAHSFEKSTRVLIGFTYNLNLWLAWVLINESKLAQYSLTRLDSEKHDVTKSSTLFFVLR